MSKATVLPPVEEMLLIASNRVGRPIDEIKKEVEKFKAGYAEIVRRNSKLMTYFYIKNVLGIDIKLSVESPTEPITISELLKTQAKSKLSTAGYIINTWGFTTQKGGEAIAFVVADKTASIQGRLYFLDAIEKWRESKVKAGDFVKIGNVAVNDWNGKRTIRGFNTTTYGIVDKELPYSYPDIVTPIGRLEKDMSAVLSVTFLNIEDRKYVGCPQCTKKMVNVKSNPEGGDPIETPVLVGTKFHCEKDGDIITEDLHFIEALATDGEADLSITFSPRLVRSTGGPDFFKEGSFYEILGALKDEKFNAESIKSLEASAAKDISQKVGAFVMNVDVMVEKIPQLVESWGEMPKDKLITNCKNLMGANEEDVKEAIKKCLLDGIITEDKGIFRIPPKKK